VFPLYVVSDRQHVLGGESGNKTANLRPEFVASLCKKLNVRWSSEPHGDMHEDIGPRDIFGYLYSILYSPSYRTRFIEFLKTDFPHVPLTEDLALFRGLALLGTELIGLHVMESPGLDEYITDTFGSASLLVEKVSYSDGIVWLDKARTCGFRGVPEEVWNFEIGGYQVCEKWLKDRQAKGGKNPRPGRVLTKEDICYYQRIVVALNETIRLMGEIDEVIDKHGGWPGAFVTEPTANSTGKAQTVPGSSGKAGGAPVSPGAPTSSPPSPRSSSQPPRGGQSQPILTSVRPRERQSSRPSTRRVNRLSCGWLLRALGSAKQGSKKSSPSS
jgi:hypothetical protein